MEKRSPKIAAVIEKKQIGCLWGLIGICELSQSRPKQKLISNKRHLNKHSGTASSESQPAHGGSDNKNLTVNADERSLQKLIAGEVSRKQVVKKQRMASEMQGSSSDNELVGSAKTRTKSGKTLRKSYQLSSHCKDVEVSVHQEPSGSTSTSVSSNKYPFTTMLEDGRNHIDDHRGIACTNCDQLSDINLPVVQMRSGELTDQMFLERKNLMANGASHQARHFLSALEIVNWNKELFLELLQDPDSLLINQVRESSNAKARKGNSKLLLEANAASKGQTGSPRNLKKPAHAAKILKKNMHHFFWKRIRSQHTYSSKEIDTGQPENRMEILKPASQSKQISENTTALVCSPLHSQPILRKKEHQDANDAFFSFKSIKRMLSHAIKESQQEQHCTSMNVTPSNLAQYHQCSKYSGEGNSQKTSSELTSKSLTAGDWGNDVDRARDARPITRPEVVSGSLCKRLNPSHSNTSKQNEIDIFVEAKKHICERLGKLNRGDTLSGKKATRTLERILSSPVHTHVLALLSPKRDREKDSVSSQIRFSSSRNSQITREFDCESDTSSTKLHDKEILPATEMHQKLSSIEDNTSSNGILQYNNSTESEDFDLVKVPYEPISTCNSIASPSTDTNKSCEETNFENQNFEYSLYLSPSSPLSIHAQEVVNWIIKDEKDQPSPVSVLEPFLKNDVTSPTRKPSQPAELPIRPLHFDFGEHSHEVQHFNPKMNSTICLNEHESICAYTRAVLQASGSSLDELLLNRPSLEQLLQTSLFDEMALYLIEFHCDPKLLFDFINEVLCKEYQSHLRCSPWISFLKPKINTVIMEEVVVDEVMKEVNCYLRPEMELHTLKQLVGKDVEKSGKWVDIQLNAEDIVIEIAEEVLEGTMIETIIEIQLWSLSC